MEPGWVRFEGDVAKVAAALPRLRTPDRLLLQIVDARCEGGDGLAALVRAQRWKDWIAPEATIDVDVHVADGLKGGGLRFRESVEKRVSWTIHEALKGPRVPERYARPRLTQRVSIVCSDRSGNDRATISLDAGGDLLHRRGWRTDVSKAPLRENIAASLLRISGWTPDATLLDPFCGSGTIPIEAALMAAGRPAFVKTTFACSEWPLLRSASVARRGQQGGPRSGQRAGGPPQRSSGGRGGIYGSDRDAKVIQAAIANAGRAGVGVPFEVRDVVDIAPPTQTGFIVTNPPWGHRLNDGGGKDSRVIPATDIFNRFAVVIAERFAGWKVVFLAPEADLARRVSPKVRPLATFPNGGVRITAWGL